MADFLYLGVFRLLAVGILTQQTIDTLVFVFPPLDRGRSVQGKHVKWPQRERPWEFPFSASTCFLRNCRHVDFR